MEFNRNRLCTFVTRTGLVSKVQAGQWLLRDSAPPTVFLSLRSGRGCYCRGLCLTLWRGHVFDPFMVLWLSNCEFPCPKLRSPGILLPGPGPQKFGNGLQPGVRVCFVSRFYFMVCAASPPGLVGVMFVSGKTRLLFLLCCFSRVCARCFLLNKELVNVEYS